MLRELSGSAHVVKTALCFVYPDADGGVQVLERVETTEVRFAPLSDEMIADYVATGAPLYVLPFCFRRRCLHSCRLPHSLSALLCCSLSTFTF